MEREKNSVNGKAEQKQKTGSHFHWVLLEVPVFGVFRLSQQPASNYSRIAEGSQVRTAGAASRIGTGLGYGNQG